MKAIYWTFRKWWFVLSVILYFPVTAQDRCGTVEYIKLLQKNKSARESDIDFEDWIARKIANRKVRIEVDASTFKVPVVVHIIHRGETVGNGLNISDAQVRSQISVLNSDFNRLNADAGNTPSEFLSVAGSINIEFTLAKQTPDGLPTSGINRVKGAKNTWTIDDDNALKATSYWPAEDYLNIWVTDLGAGLLGYAQFPISTLPGLGGAEDNRLTDGVVVDFMAFGRADDGSFNLHSNFDKGRAATHEIGHFFGLRHIWGDDNGQCGGPGDYVSDTPDQGDKTSGCPTHPYTNCSNHVMFQNYMDYTNDDCMNLYTKEQISRVATVIGNSPRRVSLNDSHGLVDPQPLANDMGIYEILSPKTHACTNSFQPSVIVKNNGSNAVASTTLQITLDQNVIESKTFTFTPALQTSETREVIFTPVSPEAGKHDFIFNIVQTNGTDDAKEPDNEEAVTTLIPYTASLPVEENFEVLPSSWVVQNPDSEITWDIRQAANSTSTNKAVYLNFYNYNNAVGEVDALVTPQLDLSNATSPYLTFDVAYSRYQSKNDGLKVFAISNCSDIDDGTEVYSKYGGSLATTSSLNSSFAPSGADQWRKEIIDLSAFIGEEKFQLAFVGVNDNGNNLYLDNVNIVLNLQENVALRQVIKPTPVQCNAEITPALVIENLGSSPLNTLEVKYTVNDGDPQTTSITGLNMQPGMKGKVTIPSIGLTEGENTLSFEIYEPNKVPDPHPEDNQLAIKTILNSDQDRIPLRETFNDEWESSWSVVNPHGGMEWKELTTNFDESIYFNAYNNSSIGDQAWVVSPVLDFSNASSASVFFDLSYRYRGSAKDEVKILASRNCGESYDEVLYSKSGDSISSVSSLSAWTPSLPSHWNREYVNLNSLAGEENVRLAFVFTNENGNNIYIDNIEFFTSDDPDPKLPENLYSVFYKGLDNLQSLNVSFNLYTRQNVRCELVDMMGKTISSQDIADVLNQTFEVDDSHASTGIYILRLLINDRYYAEKVYLN
ncbi:MAG: choice-of-anchor J domain-containing protein [Chryseolinea sp.]